MPDREATQRGRYRAGPHGVARGHTLPDSEGRTPWPVEAVYVAGM